MTRSSTSNKPSPSIYVEHHGKRVRAVWRDAEGKKQREPFATREAAERFKGSCLLNPLPKVLAVVRGQADDDLVYPVEPAPSQVGTPIYTSSATGESGRSGGVLFASFAVSILEQTTGIQGRTRDDNLQALQNHIIPYFGVAGLVLTDIRQKERPDRLGARVGPDDKPLSVSNWLLWLSTRRGFDNQGRQNRDFLKAKTIRNLHALLSFILQAAVDDDDRLLDRNPCSSSKLPETQYEERVYLEHQQFHDLLAAMPTYFRTLLAFLVATGVRWGEAAGLAAKHVHLDPPSGHPYVEILVAWRRVKGGRFELGRVKSSCSQRVITLPPVLVPLMRALLVDKAPNDPVFTMREGGRLHHSNFTRVLTKAVEVSGVPAATRCHSLRHTHVAWLIAGKEHVAMLAISRRLGHSSEAFTSKRYGHLLDRVGDTVLATVEEALTGSTSSLLSLDATVPTATQAWVSPASKDLLAVPGGPVLDEVDAALPVLDIDEDDDLAA